MKPLGHVELTKMEKLLESKNKNERQNENKSENSFLFSFTFFFCFQFAFHFRFCFPCRFEKLTKINKTILSALSLSHPPHRFSTQSTQYQN